MPKRQWLSEPNHSIGMGQSTKVTTALNTTLNSRDSGAATVRRHAVTSDKDQDAQIGAAF
jgi:hypothetical protein